MERVQSKGDAFITSEIERLNRLLGKISLHLNLHKLHLKHFFVNLVAKNSYWYSCLFHFYVSEGAISAKKNDEFSVRRNILKQFKVDTGKTEL